MTALRQGPDKRSDKLRGKVRENGVPQGDPMRSGPVRAWFCKAKVTRRMVPATGLPKRRDSATRRVPRYASSRSVPDERP
jgi:hypothetical protein